MLEDILHTRTNATHVKCHSCDHVTPVSHVTPIPHVPDVPLPQGRAELSMWGTVQDLLQNQAQLPAEDDTKALAHGWS